MAEQRAETSAVTSDCESPMLRPVAASPAASVVTSEVAPVVEADPFAYQPEAEVRSVVATRSIETVAEAPAVETSNRAGETFESQAARKCSVSHDAAIEAPVAEPEPVQIAQVETPVEAAEVRPQNWKSRLRESKRRRLPNPRQF